MKKTDIFSMLYACIICFVLISCKNTNTPDDPALEPQLVLIKLTPELQNRIFVAPVVDSAWCNEASSYHVTLFYGDSLVLNNPTDWDKELAQFAQSEFNIVGTTPYMLLENGYAIIDWKWWQFHPLSGEWRRPLYYNIMTRDAYSTYELITNEEYYLLDKTWDNLPDLTSSWKMDEGTRIEMPDIRYIYCIKIEEYGNYERGIQDIFRKYNIYAFQGLYRLYADNAEKGKAFVVEREELQAAYVKTLNDMIKNNDFEKWTKQWKK